MQTRRDELKELLMQLDSYFVMLAEQEPKKLLQRYASYLQIHEAIEDDTKSVATVCKKILEELNEKGMGRQAYSSLLKELSLVQPNERKMLLKVHQELETERGKAFIKAAESLNSNLNVYTYTLTDQIRDQLIDEPIEGEKIDRELSGKKLAIANQLIRVMENDDSSLDDFANAVVKADADHKQALKGSFNKEKRLGGLIDTAKSILKQFYPADYAKAKSDFKNIVVKEDKSDKEVTQEIKNALQDLDNYFVMLARSEPKKLMSRYDNYLDLEDKISEDFKSDKGEDLTKDNPLIYGLALGIVVRACKGMADIYRGKSGREAFSSTLMNLHDVLKKFEDQDESERGFRLLQEAQNQLKNEKKQAFIAHANELLKKIDDKYIPKLNKELNATGFFAKKINKDVSNTKKDIAEDLRDALEVAITTPKVKSKGKGKEKDATSPPINSFDERIRTLVDAVLKAEGDNKDAIKGENASEGRLGKLITEAKTLLQQYYPAYYAEGKDYFDKPKGFSY